MSTDIKKYPPTGSTKACKICKKKFKPTFKRRVYCSDPCQEEGLKAARTAAYKRQNARGRKRIDEL